jgi:stearoyl-CoA desaturase (Delta-9 desaturase)
VDASPTMGPVEVLVPCLPDGWRGALRGLAHAHVGWLFLHDQRAAKERYVRDLLKDPVIRFVNTTSLLWVLLGLAVPFALGGSIAAGLTGLLWGGAVRVFVLHHVTYSINSLCQFYGRQRFRTDDQSRNLAWLSLASLGEAWHNNHHAFPTSAFHGLHRYQLDPSALVIRLLERTGLIWDVVRISPPSAKPTAPKPKPFVVWIASGCMPT